MKKLFAILLTLLLCTGPVAHAAEYFYFNSGEMSIEIDSSNMAVLNGCTYATDRQGNLYGTHIFSEWILIEYAPKNCRIIPTNNKYDNKLLLFSENTLYVTYDGYAFTPVETFPEGSIIRYTNGLYTAMHKTDAIYHLRYSFDGLAWYDITETLTASTFSVLRVNEAGYLLKNVQTEAGSRDFRLSPIAPDYYTSHPYLTYNYITDSFTELPLTPEPVYATKTSDNLFLYVLRTQNQYSLVRLYENRTFHSMSSIIADESYDLYVLNNTVCLSKDGQSMNFINTGDTQWHQVNNDIAFPLLKNAYGLCGDVFFDGGYTQTYYCRNTVPLPTATSGTEVVLNDSYLAFDSAPQLINDRTMVPIRAIAEALDCTVSYNNVTQEIHLQRDSGVSLYMTIGQNTAKILWTDGVSADIPLDSAPVIVNDRTLVPLRFISESLDVSVQWVEETQTVILK